MICGNIIRIFLILSLFSSGEACAIPEPQKHGNWFCPPSTDLVTCHLECHPGYVSTNATVITCQHGSIGSWSEAPECITAVAIITGGSGSKNTVEVYGDGIHKKLPNLPDDRGKHSLQLVNSVLLLCSGGFTPNSCLSLTASHQWMPHSKMTSYRYGLSSVSMMGKLYLLSGWTSEWSTEHLTPPSQDWISGWDLLESSYTACAAKIEPEVLIMTGGIRYPSIFDKDYTTDKKKEYLSSAVAYNVTSGAATRLKNLITPRGQHGCALVMDTTMKGVLVAGGTHYGTSGWYHDNYLMDSEIYDVNTGEWSITGNLTIRRDGVRLVVLGNKILAMGGYDGRAYNYVSSVDQFNMTTRQWTPTEDMMERRGLYAVTGVPSTAVGIELN